MKLSKSIIALIVIASITLIILGIVIAQVLVSINTTKQAINDIGVVSYSEKSKGKIDIAKASYDNLLTGVGATTTFTSIISDVGYEKLEKAEIAYVEATIRDIVTKELSGAQDSAIKEATTIARSAFDEYFDANDANKISNYATLQSYEARYQSNTQATTDNTDQGEEPELC